MGGRGTSEHCCRDLGGGSSLKPRNFEIGCASVSKKGPTPPKGTRSICGYGLRPFVFTRCAKQAIVRYCRAPVRSRLPPAPSKETRALPTAIQWSQAWSFFPMRAQGRSRLTWRAIGHRVPFPYRSGGRNSLSHVEEARVLKGLIAVHYLLDRQPSSLAQVVVADFIEKGHLAAHIRRMRLQYRDQRDVLVAALRHRLGNVMKVDPPDRECISSRTSEVFRMSRSNARRAIMASSFAR